MRLPRRVVVPPRPRLASRTTRMHIFVPHPSSKKPTSVIELMRRYARHRVIRPLAEASKHDYIRVAEAIAGDRDFLAIPGPSICNHPGGLAIEVHQSYRRSTVQRLHVKILRRAHDAQIGDGTVIRSPSDSVYIRRSLELANETAVLESLHNKFYFDVGALALLTDIAYERAVRRERDRWYRSARQLYRGAALNRGFENAPDASELARVNKKLAVGCARREDVPAPCGDLLQLSICGIETP